MFLFDEAQLSNDSSVRGLYYDSIIRRAVNNYDKSKFVFAYPLIDNTEVQYKKNNILYTEKNFEHYIQRNVGQIFYAKSGDDFFNFSLCRNSRFKHIVGFDPLEKVIKENGTALIYRSKASMPPGKLGATSPGERLSAIENTCERVSAEREPQKAWRKHIG